MPTFVNGGLRIFRLLGIDVFVHWSWAVVALFELRARRGEYTSQIWNVAEYLALFAIVLAHEFGHSLACRSVGGRADRILLWPLGGVAFVQPPPRPGALLWSIAAGPLVNLVLLLVTAIPAAFVMLSTVSHDVHHFVVALFAINVVLLLFNLLPIYPLDGGQILQALLWFVIGRSRSLMVVSIIGLAGSAALFVYALTAGNYWLVAIAVFVALRAAAGLRAARALAAILNAPRRTGFACPRCKAVPPVGPFWRCSCGQSFDAFESQGTCPHCSRSVAQISCAECNQSSPHASFTPATSQ